MNRWIIITGFTFRLANMFIKFNFNQNTSSVFLHVPSYKTLEDKPICILLNRLAYGGWKAVLPSRYTASSSKLFVGDHTNVCSVITTALTHKFHTYYRKNPTTHTGTICNYTSHPPKKDPLTLLTQRMSLRAHNMWYKNDNLNTALF